MQAPLHQNTGRHSRFWHVGRAVFHYNRAEDPALPWWRRTWAKDDPGGGRRHMLLSLERHERGGISCYFLFVGPFQLAFAWL